MTELLGRLERVNDIRTVWPGEATDFTPWLAKPENIALLGEAIRLELVVEAQEKSVGPFRADILCKDNLNGHFVLIENQVERTDHVHLGQLLTYAAGLDAVSIVWVARQFAQEHRAALDWLNRTTTTDINFFGLEIELWRIGTSPIAPKFNVVSQPNDWSRTVRQNAETASASTPTQQLNLEFWTQFREFMDSAGYGINVGKPSSDQWKDISIGRTHFKLVATNRMRNNSSSVMVALTGPQSKAHYFALRNRHSAAIDAAIPGLQWRENPGRNESQIALEHPGAPSDRETWPDLNQWFAQTLRAFDRLFRPLVARLEPENLEGVPLGNDDGAFDREPPGD